MRQRLADVAAQASQPGKLLAEAGRYMTLTAAPKRFAVSGPGWDPLVYRSGRPLRDTGALAQSLIYKVEGGDVHIGSQLPYARLHNRGGVVVPVRGKFLAIPLSPPLTTQERRTKRPRDFAGAFVLMHGPEGPGIYRKSRGGASVNIRSRKTHYAKGQKGIERIFALVRSVRIPKRPYLYWTREDLEAIGRRWRVMFKEGG